MKEDLSREVLRFAIHVLIASNREAPVREFCEKYSLESLLIFIPDMETGVLLSAPGFPQTLPGARLWQSFVVECVEKGCAKGELPLGSRTNLRPAEGVGAQGYVAVMVGDSPPEEVLKSLYNILPVLGAALAFEKTNLAQRDQANIARQAALEAHNLALRLDEARRSAQDEIAARVRAETELRRRTRYLEILHRTGIRLAAELDISSIIKTGIRAGMEILGAEFCAFLPCADDDKFNLELHMTSGTPLAVTELFRAASDGILFHDNKKTFHSKDLLKQVNVEAKEIVLRSEARSLLSSPVKSRTGQLFGWAYFVHSKTDMFLPEMESVLEALTAQMAIALDNALLHAQLQKELTEHKKAEESLLVAKNQLVKVNAELDQRVLERTSSLQEATAQMEEFSYTVSHDLRAPLRAMQGYSEMLMEDFGELLPAAARQYLNKIKASSVRLDRMILDVLTFSRVARENLKLEPVNLCAVVEDILTNYPGMNGDSVEIEVGPMHSVLGHEPSLVQVISNLLNNALKFVKHGEKPQVKMWSDLEGTHVRFWIVDQGIGIQPEHQNRLFNMFERMHPKLDYPGTGVGLAIVRKAVVRMGGSYGLESDGQNGCKFWFLLKAA